MYDDIDIGRSGWKGIVGLRRMVCEYAFALDGIPETIRIRFYRGAGEDWIEVEQSHYLQTPGMAMPLSSDTERYVSLEHAMDTVMRGFAEGYGTALRSGRRPDVSWLLPNRDF